VPFNVDFFACAGDGRWWHDHRFPGGIAYTANSTGHMMRFRDWYQAKDQSEAWGLKQAMLNLYYSVLCLARPGPVDLPGVVLRDLPVVQAVVLLTAGIVIAVNLLVDIIYAYLDPRIRYE
jgi:hypothetical protein